jgi:hypothetical protein
MVYNRQYIFELFSEQVLVFFLFVQASSLHVILLQWILITAGFLIVLIKDNIHVIKIS